MRPTEFRQARQLFRLTQDQLPDQLKTTRRSVIRYEDGSRRIPGMAEVALQHLATTHISMAGIVAAGEPIEPIPQTERVEVPKSMLGRGDTFGLRVKGDFDGFCTGLKSKGVAFSLEPVDFNPTTRTKPSGTARKPSSLVDCAISTLR